MCPSSTTLLLLCQHISKIDTVVMNNRKAEIFYFTSSAGCATILFTILVRGAILNNGPQYKHNTSSASTASTTRLELQKERFRHRFFLLLRDTDPRPNYFKFRNPNKQSALDTLRGLREHASYIDIYIIIIQLLAPFSSKGHEVLTIKHRHHRFKNHRLHTHESDRYQ